MSGKKGRSGRQKRSIELARARGKDDALSCVRRRLPEILEVIVQKAEAGDKECAVYCVDRVLGRPKIELDQRFKGEFDVTPDPSMLLQAVRKIEANRAEFLKLPERQLPSPTRELSYDPVPDTPFREGEIAQKFHCANSTDSVGIPPEDPGSPPA